MEDLAKLFCVGFGMLVFIALVLFAFSLARMAKDRRDEQFNSKGEYRCLSDSDHPDGDEKKVG